MTAKFYIISLGPGNPELITIQALRVLEDCDVIFVPVRSPNLEWKGSVAYQILKNIYDTHEKWFKDSAESFNFIKNWEEKFAPIYTPMSYDPDSWKDQVEQILNACNSQSRVGFVTLGDAGLFSSAYYLLDIITGKHPEISQNTEVIPGISSISYASSLVKKPLCLGNSKLEIVPMHGEEIHSTKVYMRLHKGDDVSNLEGNGLYYFENLGLKNESFSKGTPGIIEN
ncbi:MAG TPA: cobalt-precorrin-2 C(20)-methyltransferase [Cyanobacteria bacterium UBA9579]|nr:cobalt-precorrin-2 C(20)-methyltransferase [Cyanobacteria bacterium UBA9579]